MPGSSTANFAVRPESRALVAGMPPLNAALIAATLDDAGFEVQIAHDLRAAATACRSEPFQLAIVDIDVAEAALRDFVKIFRRRQNGSFVIGVGNTDAGETVDWVLARPFPPQTLRDLLRVFCAAAPGPATHTWSREARSGH